MRISVLSSGSSGNCTYVEAAQTRLLVDAGISARRIEAALAALGTRMLQVTAILITHEHADHVRGLATLDRRYDLPVYLTHGTLRGLKLRNALPFAAGDPFTIGDVAVQSFRTPHDASEPVGLVVESGGRRLGIFTDLGSAFEGMSTVLGGLDAVLLETNHDLQMLDGGPYPSFLKRRIRGATGHLSNDDAVEILSQSSGARLRTVFLSHLSAVNNDPSRVSDALARGLDPATHTRLRFILTDGSSPTELIEV